MYFKKQFESFNPLTGHLPYIPFSFLPEIAYRAREKLKSRTTEQITSAAINISKAITDYFQDEKHGAIVELQRGLRGDDEALQEYFEWVGGAEDGGSWVFKDSMMEELDIPSDNNTSEVGALKERFKRICLPNPEPCTPQINPHLHLLVASLLIGHRVKSFIQVGQ